MRSPTAIHSRPFLFLIVPVIGAGLAVVVGGAIVIYGMEAYREYNLRKEAELAKKPTQIDKASDDVKP